MDRIDRYVIAAKELGLSYGYYVASLYDPSRATPTYRKGRKYKQRPLKFNEQRAFSLWQQYMTDEQIAEAVGVTRANIQRWRSRLKLPSTFKNDIETKKYRLTNTQDGTSIVFVENDEL